MTTTETAASPTPTRLERMSATYREDHQNPINHFLHVGVGWPIAAIAVIVAPFRPLLGLELFVLAYIVMWTGHFVFERNLPTVFKQPSTPFLMAWTVIRQIVSGLGRLVFGGRAGS
jgi:hypothetical protein